jgi:hypothetical protein
VLRFALLHVLRIFDAKTPRGTMYVCPKRVCCVLVSAEGWGRRIYSGYPALYCFYHALNNLGSGTGQNGLKTVYLCPTPLLSRHVCQRSVRDDVLIETGRVRKLQQSTVCLGVLVFVR